MAVAAGTSKASAAARNETIFQVLWKLFPTVYLPSLLYGLADGLTLCSPLAVLIDDVHRCGSGKRNPISSIPWSR